MHDVKIRRQLDTQGLGEISKSLCQDLFRCFKVIGNLRLARDIGAGEIELSNTFKVTYLHFLKNGMGFFWRHTDQREEESAIWFAFLEFQQVVKIVVQTIVGQAHGVDRPQRNILIARFWVSLTKFQRRCLGHKRSRSRIFDFCQFLFCHAGNPSCIHQAVVKCKTSNLCRCRNHSKTLLFF